LQAGCAVLASFVIGDATGGAGGEEAGFILVFSALQAGESSRPRAAEAAQVGVTVALEGSDCGGKAWTNSSNPGGGKKPPSSGRKPPATSAPWRNALWSWKNMLATLMSSQQPCRNSASPAGEPFGACTELPSPRPFLERLFFKGNCSCDCCDWPSNTGSPAMPGAARPRPEESVGDAGAKGWAMQLALLEKIWPGT